MPNETAMDTGIVNTDRVNLRLDPDVTSELIGIVAKGITVEIVSTREMDAVLWLLVATRAGEETLVGWIQSTFINRESSENGGGPAPETGDIQGKPGPNQAVVNQLIAGALRQGLDPMMVLTVVAIESDFVPTKTNRNSSAGGLFQFIDPTWFSVDGPPFPGRGGINNGHAAAAPIAMQIQKGCKFLADIIGFLKNKLPRTPSTTDIYMCHQQGNAGAIKILEADPGKPIEAVIGGPEARLNGFGGLTVGQTINKFHQVVISNEAQARGEIIPSAPVSSGGTNTAVTPVDLALSDWEQFARKGTIKEGTQPLKGRVLEYFRSVGLPNASATGDAWSAAFVSFMMHKGGKTQFPESPAHATYILAGLEHRIANRLDAPVVYFDRDEKAPRVGDLIGFSRTARVKNREVIEAFLDKPPKDRFFPAHTDLVWKVDSDTISIIGGNVSQTISVKKIKIDAEGRIADRSAQHFFLLRINI